MKKKLPKIIVTAIVLSFSFSAFSQVQKDDKRVEEKSVSENGQPNLIKFNELSSYKSSESQKVFKEQLGLKDSQSFTKIKTESDKQGYRLAPRRFHP